MGVFLVKRILSVIPILLLAVLILTGLIHLSPVDPAQAYLSAAHIQPTDELLAAKRAEFGLDQPFYQQYFDAVIRLAQLDFGTSYLSGKPVLEDVLLRLPPTVELAVTSLLLALVISIPLGFLAGIKKNGFFDHLSRAIAFIGASIPSFWLSVHLLLCRPAGLVSGRWDGKCDALNLTGIDTCVSVDCLVYTIAPWQCD